MYKESKLHSLHCSIGNVWVLGNMVHTRAYVVAGILSALCVGVVPKAKVLSYM